MIETEYKKNRTEKRRKFRKGSKNKRIYNPVSERI